ncbi:RDD family protein [Mycolicibacterium sp. YH-1]|uniref:RDD family protein n=1 Tax=Mycolicibacterium sp. YH-1 TaxID=2908837 RepID=UPI001F4C1BB6|nr:RDD family protein [Mycolicibacterium sp. YH-1]UNB54112.1 RDD family protein [Mycolicibacterium sp. YH-1]
MTDQPPPPGNYPPPPPQGGGYPPPPPPQGGGYPPPAGAPGGPGAALPTEAYTPWVTRVLAFLIDYVPFIIIVGIGWAIQMLTQETDCITQASEYDLGEFCVTQNSALGAAAFWISYAIGLAYIVWNYGYRQGTTGSSIGKSIMKFKVVSEKTWQPIGFGMSIVRQLAHIVDSIICYIGYLFPLWDSKRQTIADKIMTTVCVPL